jgi:hypothetical protein
MVLENLNSTIIPIYTKFTLRHCKYGTSCPCPQKRKKVQEDGRQAYIPEVRTFIAVYYCCGIEIKNMKNCRSSSANNKITKITKTTMKIWFAKKKILQLKK